MKKLYLKTPLALVLLTGLAISGCVSPPKVEQHSHEIESTNLGLSSEALAKVSNEWWKVFGDPQLNQLVDDALVSNPNLEDAVNRVRIAQAQAIAAGAALKPGFSLEANETRQRLSEHYIYPPKGLGFGVAGGDIAWMGQTTANLSWDLDFWGKASAQLQQARKKIDASFYDGAATRLALSGAMAQAYVELYRAYLNGDIASQQQIQRETLLKITQKRVQAGLDSAGDLKAVEASLPAANIAKLQTDLQQKMAVHALAALAGKGADAYEKINRPQINPEADLPLPNSISLNALAKRPDVLAAKARVEAAVNGKTAAKAAFYPNINLNAFVGLQAIGLEQLTDSGSLIYGAGPAIHLPLFDSQRLKAAYFASSTEYDLAVGEYNETLLKAVREIADELAKVQSLLQQREQIDQQVTLQKQQYALVLHKFKVGLMPQVAVLNAQSQLLSAERDAVNIHAQLLISRVTLLLMCGGSFDPNAVTAANGVSQ